MFSCLKDITEPVGLQQSGSFHGPLFLVWVPQVTNFTTCFSGFSLTPVFSIVYHFPRVLEEEDSQSENSNETQHQDRRELPIYCNLNIPEFLTWKEKGMRRNGGNVETVRRVSDLRPSWKLISAFTLGRSRSPALSVGRHSVGQPTCYNTSKFTLKRNRSPANSVVRDSLNPPTCGDTSVFIVERHHSPAPSAGRDLLDHQGC